MRTTLYKLFIELAFYVAPKSDIDTTQLKRSIYDFFESVEESNKFFKKNIK